MWGYLREEVGEKFRGWVIRIFNRIEFLVDGRVSLSVWDGGVLGVF